MNQRCEVLNEISIFKPWNCYISQEMAVRLKEHKYAGCDEGIAYIYFWNPVANWLVQFLPETVAPNTLTLFGFIHTLAPVIVLIAVCGPEFDGDVPSWFCFFQTWCFFAYRMLDEMDGKQARKTKNSSPLGLIFDHGCDAFSMGFQMIMLAKTMQIGNNQLMNWVMVSTYASFHFATLEEYYTGILYLPPLNPVSEGSVFMILGFIVTGLLWGTGLS